MTAQGHPRTVFRRALDRGNLMLAEATAREVGRIYLNEALELTALIAQKEPHRHGRAAARWLRRYLEERKDAHLEEVALIVSALQALGGPNHGLALTLLRSLAAD